MSSGFFGELAGQDAVVAQLQRAAAAAAALLAGPGESGGKVLPQNRGDPQGGSREMGPPGRGASSPRGSTAR